MLRCGGVKNRRILSDLDVKQHTASPVGMERRAASTGEALCIGGGEGEGQTWEGWPTLREMTINS